MSDKRLTDFWRCQCGITNHNGDGDCVDCCTAKKEVKTHDPVTKEEIQRYYLNKAAGYISDAEWCVRRALGNKSSVASGVNRTLEGIEKLILKQKNPIEA